MSGHEDILISGALSSSLCVAGDDAISILCLERQLPPHLHDAGANSGWGIHRRRRQPGDVNRLASR